MGTTMFSSLSNKEKLIHELKDFYIPYRERLGLPNDTTFGLEIEFNIKGYDTKYKNKLYKEGYTNFEYQFLLALGLNTKWKIAYEMADRIEIISDVLNDDCKAWQYLKELLEFLTNHGAYYNGRGGSHVHVGYHVLQGNYDYITRFLKLYSCYENEIIRFTNGEYYFDRKEFCMMCRRLKEVLYRFLKQGNPELDLPKEICDKVHSLSLFSTDVFLSGMLPEDPFSYNVSNTIEFRSPTLTLNPIIWQNNVNLITKLLLSASSANFDDELLDYAFNLEKNKTLIGDSYSDEKAFELCDLVFDNDFDKYCFLRQYYKDFDNPAKKEAMAKSKPFWK